MSRELEAAAVAVRRAGAMLLQASEELKVLQFKDDAGTAAGARKGLVTEMDRRCEEAIVEVLHSAFPEDGFLGEELTSHNLASERVWVIDPLDGTIAYARGLDTYATCVGLLVHGEPVLGVVFLPRQGELFTAERGSGAYLNGVRIRVAQTDALENGIVSLDHRIFRADLYPRVTRDLLKTIRRLRVSDSCSQEFCLLACGRIDGMVRMLQPTYDYMMGKVIAEEAGGVVRDFHGQPVVPLISRERNANLIAGNAGMVRLLAESFS